MTVDEWVETWVRRAPVLPVERLRELLERLGEGEEES